MDNFSEKVNFEETGKSFHAEDKEKKEYRDWQIGQAQIGQNHWQWAEQGAGKQSEHEKKKLQAACLCINDNSPVSETSKATL